MAHHHHHHGHGEDAPGSDVDWAEMAEPLEAQAELFAPLYTQVLTWLGEQVAEPALIVDAGSGPGVVSCRLARTFPGARVLAVDAAAPLLERAGQRAAGLGLADRFATLAGELPSVLAESDGPVDLLWAARSLHHIGDQGAALIAFADRLAPGGTLALMEGGLPARYLPRDLGLGRPGLQSRLDGAQAAWFARMRAGLPGSVAGREDWPALLAAAGLKHTGTRTFLLDLPAPASEQARAYVATSLSWLREACAEEIDTEDLTVLDRLLDPDDEAGVHRRPDVFVLAAHTVYTAVRPA
ncbi:methyltransferase domain-containing protein [Streptomyces adustus]|uniref:class I SAM-dependent methyltransferase n=1 Tax=Streptomyces adustus TaxID=1609272 RepID=UPI0035D5E7E8